MLALCMFVISSAEGSKDWGVCARRIAAAPARCDSASALRGDHNLRKEVLPSTLCVK